MLSAEEIRNITFSKSMNGYKKEEVEILLDKIEADYDQFRRQLRLLQEKNAELQKQISDSNSSKDSIQTVLVSAQKLADQIVNDAKAQADEIISKTDQDLLDSKQVRQQQLDALERAIAERKVSGEKEIADMMIAAEKKRDSMLAATSDSIARQQALFDKLHIETTTFKNEMLSKCSEFATLLSKLPNEVPLDAKRAAAAVEELFLNKPDINEFIEDADTEDDAQADTQTEADDNQAGKSK